MDPVGQAILDIIRDNAPAGYDYETTARRITRGLVLRVLDEAASLDIPNNLQNPAFKNIYAAHFMKLYSNLNPDNGRHLLEMIYSGFIMPLDVASLTSAEMNPAANAHIRDEISLRMQQKVDLKYSTAYRCSKCGERKATYHESQNRAADEQSTINLKCLNCGHTWRR